MICKDVFSSVFAKIASKSAKVYQICIKVNKMLKPCIDDVRKSLTTVSFTNRLSITFNQVMFLEEISRSYLILNRM